MTTGTTPEPKTGQNTDQAGDDTNQPDINAIVNSAVTAQLKRALAPKTLAAALAPLIADVVKPLQDELATLKQAPPATPATGPAPGPAPDKPNPELTAVKQQLQEMKDQLAKERDRAAAAETKQRDDAAFGALKTQLSAAKVRPEMVEALAKVLFLADKRVEFDENGKPLLRVRVAPSKGMAEEDQLLTLEDGVKAFVKSKEAEPWLPAPGGAPGTPGQRRPAPTPGGQPPVNQSQPTTEEEMRARSIEQMTALGVHL